MAGRHYLQAFRGHVRHGGVVPSERRLAVAGRSPEGPVTRAELHEWWAASGQSWSRDVLRRRWEGQYIDLRAWAEHEARPPCIDVLDFDPLAEMEHEQHWAIENSIWKHVCQRMVAANGHGDPKEDERAGVVAYDVTVITLYAVEGYRSEHTKQWVSRWVSSTKR
jgi:hypothetical protein